MLLYIGRVYEKIIEAETLYKQNRITIPLFYQVFTKNKKSYHSITGKYYFTSVNKVVKRKFCCGEVSFCFEKNKKKWAKKMRKNWQNTTKHLTFALAKTYFMSIFEPFSEFNNFGLRSSVFGLRSSVFGLRSSVFGLRSSVFGLRSSATNYIKKYISFAGENFSFNKSLFLSNFF